MLHATNITSLQPTPYYIANPFLELQEAGTDQQQPCVQALHVLCRAPLHEQQTHRGCHECMWGAWQRPCHCDWTAGPMSAVYYVIKHPCCDLSSTQLQGTEQHNR